MPARQKPTLIELMIMVAILGILAAIVIPAMEQARRRAQVAGRGAERSGRVAEEPGASEGQLNTIEVSEVPQSTEHADPGQYVGVVVGLIPIILAVMVVWFIIGRFRQQMSRRA